MKEREKNMETYHDLIGNIYYNRAAASGAPIAVRRKWRLKSKRLG
jgi:hypothetical protein